MSYQHLTTFERARIETLLKFGYSQRDIAKKLNRSPSTISRELQRNDSQSGEYKSEVAQMLYQDRRKHCVPKGKHNVEIVLLIEEKLKLTWSPEQIVGRLFQGILSFKTIYRWLYQGVINLDNNVLRHKGKRQKPHETRGRFNIGTSISKRPKEVKKRKTFGHWELDTMVSGRGSSKGCLSTFVERKTRKLIALKMPNRTKKSMERSIRSVHRSLPTGAFKTATVDRGKEFACYSTIEADLKINIYFADPYAAWQRGSNENSNGLIREFYPKATNLNLIKKEELEYYLELINNRPRKCLGWLTANEAFEQELLRLG